VIVVDTSILVSLVIEGDLTDTVMRLRKRDADWVAPILWRSELCNVLATHVRLSRVDLPDAIAHFRAADKAMRGMGYQVEPERVLRMASEHGLTGYDAEFAALALDLGVPLVTTDRELLNALPETATTPENFTG
jgi:predicted nucleic acid-binding protein